MEQRVHTTRLDDGRTVAYALCGSGPLLVFPPPWVSHLEMGWALPAERRFYEALAQGRTLLRYDRLGCGLSAADSDHSIESDVETLRAVLRAVGAKRFDLFGTSMGSFTAIAWSALHPETVEHLVVYGGWVRGVDVAPEPVRKHVLGLVRAHWGLGSDVLAEILMAEADPATRAAFVHYQRESASPDVAAAVLERAYAADLSGVITAVKAPTLVLHRDTDRAAPVAQARLLARGIPGAELVILSGKTHVAFLGDAQAVVREVRRFLGLKPVTFGVGPSLTPRQREVAGMVAAGLTNRDIASRLGIDERSAEGHVERIRDRLGFRSRAQIAAWWVLSGN